MTDASFPRPKPGGAPAPAPASVLACCSTVYGSPLAELLVGDSLHPGGLESTRRLLEASKLRPGARLLDAGCGLGASSRLAATAFGLTVDAVDASSNVLARLEARPTTERIRWVGADLLALPYPAAAFDGVLAECVLSTVPRATALDELSRVLRPGGMLLLSDVVMAGDSIPALADHRLLGAALCVTDAWSPGELEAQLRAAGFTIERRWELTRSILALVDRVEARIGFAAVAARDLGLDLAVLTGEGADGPDAFRPEQAHRLADEIRGAVRRGDLRYVAVVARAGGQGSRAVVCEQTRSVVGRATAGCRSMTRKHQPVHPQTAAPVRPQADNSVRKQPPRGAPRPSHAERADVVRRAQRRRSTIRLGGIAGVGLAVVGLLALNAGVGQADVGVRAPTEGGVGVHLPAGAALPQRNRPPSSGPHYAGRAAYGTFGSPVPAGNWVHVLEHGGIAVLFKCANPTECGASASRLRTQVYDRARNGAFGERKLVMTPYQEMDAPITAVAWGRVLELQQIDPQQLLAFYNRYLDRGPEQAP